VKLLRATVDSKKAIKKKETASVAVSYCEIVIVIYRVVSAGRRSLRFFRNAMIGFSGKTMCSSGYIVFSGKTKSAFQRPVPAFFLSSFE
jgi:hypothetical protein